jgi:hypothetical protein
VPDGDVEQLLRGLWLIVAELMHQGPVVHAGPKCQDDIGIIDLGELVALAGKPSNVIPEGLVLVMSATLQIPMVARPLVRALKVAGEDLPKTLPAFN